jgi:hypothetical protein
MVILAVLQSGYSYISSATKWLWLYQQCYRVVMVVLVLQHGYGYISSATKWLWLY